MSTPSHSHIPSPNAAVVIRERIREKRLFEAQFLFGLLDEDDISPQERQVLERELEGLLAVVRDLQIQANKYLAEGEYKLARKMHREMERIAVDVPGLQYGKRQAEAHEEAALRERAIVEESDGAQAPTAEAGMPFAEGTEAALLSENSPVAGTEDAEVSGGLPDADEALPVETAAAGPDAARPGRAGKKLVPAVIVLALVLIGLLALHVMRREDTADSGKTQNTEVEITPLSVRQGEEPPDQRADTTDAGQSVITIGELTIE